MPCFEQGEGFDFAMLKKAYVLLLKNKTYPLASSKKSMKKQ